MTKSPVVCIVEDDVALAELAKERLAMHGFHASVYYNARMALPLVIAKQADLVLCDVGLPYVDGVSFAEELLQQLEGCRLVLMSGSPLSRSGEELLERFATRCVFLRKPFSMERLLKALEEVYFR